MASIELGAAAVQSSYKVTPSVQRPVYTSPAQWDAARNARSFYAAATDCVSMGNGVFSQMNNRPLANFFKTMNNRARSMGYKDSELIEGYGEMFAQLYVTVMNAPPNR